MHVTILTDREADGGANIAAYRITEALAAAGHRITTVYQHGETDARWQTRSLPSRLATHRLPFLRRTAARLVPRSVRVTRHQQESAADLEKTLREIRPDVVSAHNLHIAEWSMEMIRAASRVAPVVCTLHDTWTMTGRCVYPVSCQKFLTGCDEHCPTADEYPALRADRIADEWNLRRDILHHCTNVAAVAPSDWLAGLAASGLWSRRQVFMIPYPLDLRRFDVMEREMARRNFGISPNERTILVSASDLSSPRKGVRLVLDALRLGLGRPVRLLLVGVALDVAPMPDVTVQQLGFIADDSVRAQAYNCADLFVHSALADNAPLTVMESLACGTPVVAFPVDGLPETVVAHQTGWLAESVCSEALRTALLMAMADLDSGVDLRPSCRAFAESRYDPSAVARQYQAVFERMQASAPASSI